jgi:uncharacterized Ntn-hydrolase superfamily protein
VALDRADGKMGVAVQSHWFSVGSTVTWAEAGVGVVATQSFVEASYGPLGLKLMKALKSPRDALDLLLGRDRKPEVRQVAMVNTKGEVAVHTGTRCLPESGHEAGKGFSAQANLMSTDRVWVRMASRFRSSRGSLAGRLMAALEAGEAAGGDIRGRQSAAMLIVRTEQSPKPWEGEVLDLRVEDNPEPLKELKRLVRLHEAYTHADMGDELVTEGKMRKAMKEYSLAARLAPQVEELKFWQAVGLLNHGDRRGAMVLMKDVFRRRQAWRRVLAQLPKYGLLKAPESLVNEILSI